MPKPTFELHNTFLIEPKDVTKFKDLCKKHALKCLDILVLYNIAYNASANLEMMGRLKNTDDFQNVGYEFEPVILYQTSVYLTCEYTEAKNTVLGIRQLFTSNGFIFIREKIEVIRGSVNLLPVTEPSENMYYETHIVINCEKYSVETIRKLDAINKEIGKFNILQHGLYVPMAVNMSKFKDNQITITAKHYLKDVQNQYHVDKCIEEYKTLITKDFSIVKVIGEIVIFDTNEFLDIQQFDKN